MSERPFATVLFYQHQDGTVPFLDFLATVPLEVHYKYVAHLERLEALGPTLYENERKKLDEGFYLISVRYQHLCTSLIYFGCGEDSYVVSHGYYEGQTSLAVQYKRAVEHRARFMGHPQGHQFLPEGPDRPPTPGPRSAALRFLRQRTASDSAYRQDIIDREHLDMGLSTTPLIDYLPYITPTRMGSMADRQHLLDDAQMQQFIRDGYVQVKADFVAPLHQQIYDQLENVFEKEGNLGNNILPRVPQIKEVFDHPAVTGALTSLLGPDYTMNPHRHCHLNSPGGKGQNWHKDCYVFDHNMRHPHFHWVLALYYPQDTTEDMGPTGILPGVQNWEHISDANPEKSQEQALALCGKAGTVTLLHFDSWHCVTANTSAHKRYMLKFQFGRMQWPPAPTWNHQSAEWAEADPVARHTWDWLCGQPEPEVAPEGPAANLLHALEHGTEAERLHAAYALGTHGEKLVPDLLDMLRREARAVEHRIEAKTADNAHGTNPTALRAAQALGAIGPRIAPALVAALADEHWLLRAALCDVFALWGISAAVTVPALTQCLEDEHWWVRRNAVEALGRMGDAACPALSALAAALSDEDRRVRRVAALALAQIGTYTEQMVPALKTVLADEDRYNRFYAHLALSRLDHVQARDVLLDALFTARWCPLTSNESRY